MTTTAAEGPSLQEGMRHYLDSVVALWAKAPGETPISLQTLQDLQAIPGNAFDPAAEDALRLKQMLFDEFADRGHITQGELMARLQELNYTPEVKVEGSKLAQASQREAAPTPQQAQDRKEDQENAKAPRPAARGLALPNFGRVRKNSLTDKAAEATFEKSVGRTRDYIAKTNTLLAEMPGMEPARQELAKRQVQKMVMKIDKGARQLAATAEKHPKSAVVQNGMDAIGKDLQGLGKSIAASPLPNDIRSKMDEMLKDLTQAIAALVSKLFGRGAGPQPS